MKLNVSYTKSVIFRRNLPLLSGLLALCMISFALVYFNWQNYQANQTKLLAMESELDTLNRKKSLIDFKNQVIDSKFDLDAANKVLTQLIPTKEDYFSILAALEKISAKTNFIITSYNINVNASTKNKLAILIEGKGDPNSFLEFLKEYNFSGGRLLTIDKIDFSQEAFSDTKISVYVYSGTVNAKQPPTTENVDIQLISQILDKVEVDLLTESTDIPDYATKTNPF